MNLSTKIKITNIYQCIVKIPNRGSVLSFDFGTRRIGIAVGELELKTVHPLQTIDKIDNESRFKAIDLLIQEWKPVALLVGIPYHVDGAEQEMTHRAFKFARQLAGRFHLPVAGFNECLTSRHASTSLDILGIYDIKQKPYLDQVSALHLLESWFELILPSSHHNH